MANDREVLREIWEGKIPVCFQLDAEEVCELQAPDPFYLMVPRLSYFPLCTDKVTASRSKFEFFNRKYGYPYRRQERSVTRSINPAGEKTFYASHTTRQTGERNVAGIQWDAVEMALSHRSPARSVHWRHSIAMEHRRSL